MRRGYDGITISSLPTDGDVYFGYVGGSWPTYLYLKAMFPTKVCISIAVNATEMAKILDVENGDAKPADAPGWAVRMRTVGITPCVYCSTSVWPAVRAAFAVASVPLPLWWEAHYDGIPVISPGAIAKQYQNGPRYDTSVVADYWPGVDAPTEPPMPIGDDMTPAEMLAALDQAAKSTEAGTPVPGTGFIEAIAHRVVAMLNAQPKGTS